MKFYVKPSKEGSYRYVAYVSHTTAGFGGTRESADAARRRAVKDDSSKQRCGVKANVNKNGANACVGGVQAGNGSASVGSIRAR